MRVIHARGRTGDTRGSGYLDKLWHIDIKLYSRVIFHVLWRHHMLRSVVDRFILVAVCEKEWLLSGRTWALCRFRNGHGFLRYGRRGMGIQYDIFVVGPGKEHGSLVVDSHGIRQEKEARREG